MDSTLNPPLPSLNALMVMDAFPDGSTPEELAGACLDQHKIVQQAIGPMMARVRGDDAMRAQVIDRLLEAECRRILDTTLAGRHQAEKRRTGGGPLGAVRKANLAAHAQAVRSALFDDEMIPTHDGPVKLGDATRSDLSEAMGLYQLQSRDADIKFRWLRDLQQILPAGKRVREAITEERATELRDIARRGDA